MEPKLPTPHFSPETSGYKPETPITQERNQTPNVEVVNIRSSELETHEADPSMAIASATPAAAVIQPVKPTVRAQSQIAQPTQKNDNPLVANDDDIIEKEWVNKAKQIVKNTKSDPYTQEREVSKLQADYLKKRYGKDVKVFGD